MNAIPNIPPNPLHQLHITIATFHLLPTNFITPLSFHVVLALFIVQKNLPRPTNVLYRLRGPRRRPRSSPPSTGQRRDYSPQKGRDSSVTLRSVSPNGWSSSYDLDREDRTRYRSQGHSSRPAEPDPPQWHQQERSSTYADPSHRHSHHQDSSTWPEWDNYVGQMGQSTIHGKSPIVAQSTNIPFQFISPPILARTTLPSTLTCSSPVRSSIYKHKTTHCILFVLKTPQDLETPSSEPGYHSRGSSTIPEGHIQISLQDDHKHVWIKSGSSLA